LEEQNLKKLQKHIIERAKSDEEFGRYNRLITVMFADLMGSTAFFDRYGDVAGFVRIQQFTEILKPLVEEYGGMVCKTMGDIVMAYFEDPVQSARCACRMLVLLGEFNARPQMYEGPMQACFGLNYGSGLVIDQDVFGHVVNVAMLIKRLAGPDQILLSRTLAEKLQPANLPLRKLELTEIKGMPEGTEIYELLWREIA